MADLISLYSEDPSVGDGGSTDEEDGNGDAGLDPRHRSSSTTSPAVARRARRDTQTLIGTGRLRSQPHGIDTARHNIHQQHSYHNHRSPPHQIYHQNQQQLAWDPRNHASGRDFMDFQLNQLLQLELQHKTQYQPQEPVYHSQEYSRASSHTQRGARNVHMQQQSSTQFQPIVIRRRSISDTASVRSALSSKGSMSSLKQTPDTPSRNGSMGVNGFTNNDAGVMRIGGPPASVMIPVEGVSAAYNSTAQSIRPIYSHGPESAGSKVMIEPSSSNLWSDRREPHGNDRVAMSKFQANAIFDILDNYNPAIEAHKRAATPIATPHKQSHSVHSTNSKPSNNAFYVADDWDEPLSLPKFSNFLKKLQSNVTWANHSTAYNFAGSLDSRHNLPTNHSSTSPYSSPTSSPVISGRPKPHNLTTLAKSWFNPVASFSASSPSSPLDYTIVHPNLQALVGSPSSLSSVSYNDYDTSRGGRGDSSPNERANSQRTPSLGRRKRKPSVSRELQGYRAVASDDHATPPPVPPKDDSLLEALKSPNEDEIEAAATVRLQIDSLIDRAVDMLNYSVPQQHIQLESAIGLLRAAVDMAQYATDWLRIAKGCNLLGIAMRRIGNFEESLAWLDRGWNAVQGVVAMFGDMPSLVDHRDDDFGLSDDGVVEHRARKREVTRLTRILETAFDGALDSVRLACESQAKKEVPQDEEGLDDADDYSFEENDDVDGAAIKERTKSVKSLKANKLLGLKPSDSPSVGKAARVLGLGAVGRASLDDVVPGRAAKVLGVGGSNAQLSRSTTFSDFLHGVGGSDSALDVKRHDTISFENAVRTKTLHSSSSPNLRNAPPHKQRPPETQRPAKIPVSPPLLVATMDVLTSLGNTFSTKGSIDLAIHHHLACLKLAEHIVKNLQSCAYSNGLIAGRYLISQCKAAEVRCKSHLSLLYNSIDLPDSGSDFEDEGREMSDGDLPLFMGASFSYNRAVVLLRLGRPLAAARHLSAACDLKRSGFWSAIRWRSAVGAILIETGRCASLVRAIGATGSNVSVPVRVGSIQGSAAVLRRSNGEAMKIEDNELFKGLPGSEALETAIKKVELRGVDWSGDTMLGARLLMVCALEANHVGDAECEFYCKFNIASALILMRCTKEAMDVLRSISCPPQYAPQLIHNLTQVLHQSLIRTEARIAAWAEHPFSSSQEPEAISNVTIEATVAILTLLNPPTPLDLAPNAFPSIIDTNKSLPQLPPLEDPPTLPELLFESIPASDLLVFLEDLPVPLSAAARSQKTDSLVYRPKSVQSVSGQLIPATEEVPRMASISITELSSVWSSHLQDIQRWATSQLNFGVGDARSLKSAVVEPQDLGFITTSFANALLQYTLSRPSTVANVSATSNSPLSALRTPDLIRQRLCLARVLATTLDELNESRRVAGIGGPASALLRSVNSIQQHAEGAEDSLITAVHVAAVCLAIEKRCAELAATGDYEFEGEKDALGHLIAGGDAMDVEKLARNAARTMRLLIVKELRDCLRSL